MKLSSFQKRPSHTMLLLIAFILASFSLLVVYPGVMYSDSYNRISMAQLIETGQTGFRQYLTVLPSVFIALFHFITNNYATYALVQAVFFLWTILEVFYLCIKNTIFVIIAFVALSPILIGYSIYWETGPVVAAMLVWLVIIDQKTCPDNKRKMNGTSILYWVLYFVCCFVITGYRINAATAIVGLLVWNVFVCGRGKRFAELFKKCAFAILGILTAILLPIALGIQSGNNMGVGMLWETACVINRIGPGKGYDTYLDDLIGDGNTEKIFDVENPEESMYNFSDVYDFYGITINDHGAIRDKYLNIIKEEPIQFCKVKFKIIGNVLTQANFWEYDRNRYDEMHNYGFSDTMRRDRAIETVVQYMNRLTFLRTPVFLFVMALALLIVCCCLRIQVIPLIKTFFVACYYEGGYFITTQAYEFRYFFPAWLLLVLVILAAAGNIVRGLWANGHPQAEVLEYGIEKGETVL